MASSAADTFTFIRAMNVGKPAPAFDREASAKLFLSFLASHDGPQQPSGVGRSLDLTPDQYGQVVEYLADSGLIEHVDGERVALSGFGRDALRVFTLA